MSFHFTKLASSKINTKLLHAAQCALCPLANNPKNKNSNMPPDGSLHPDVLLLGLGPDEVEDAKGKPFVGPSGEFLRSCFSEDQWEKTRRNNVTRTRELNNKPPLEAVECCRPSVEKDILATKPKAIFGFGEYPLKWILGDKFTDEIKVNVWRNRHFPVSVKGHEMWYFPMFHPSYIIRSNKNKPELTDLFKRDIKSAYDFLDKGIKPHVVNPTTYFDGVEIEYKSIAKIEQFINELLKTSNRFAIDIETAATLPPGHNLYRPYHQNSKILTVSIGTFQKCMAFPLDHPEAKWTENERKKLDLLLLKLLLSNLIKEAHNSVYELEWLLYKYSKKIAYKNWICTLTQGYILNGRRGLLGLGELTLLYFGFNLKHLSHVDSANLATEPLEDVLTYNCLMHGNRVITKNGPIDIYKIVKNKLQIEVLSLNEETNQLEYQPIINWHHQCVKNQNWLQIQPKYNNKRGIVCTPEHKILTQIGKIEAKDLDIKKHKLLGNEIKLSSEQKGALIGTLLGDSFFGKKNLVYIGCSQRNQQLIEFKYKLFSNFNPTITSKYSEDGFKPGFNYNLYLPSSVQFSDIYHEVVINNTYKSPKKILKYLNPLGIALWYMDDGFVQKQKNEQHPPLARIALQKFLKEDQDFISDWFNKFLDLPAAVRLNGRINSHWEYGTAVNSQGNLCFSRPATDKLFKIISQYILPEFRYKLYKNDTFNEFDVNFKINQLNEPYEIEIEKIEPFTKKFKGKHETSFYNHRYCLTINKNHNFMTTYGLVANCLDSKWSDAIYLHQKELLEEDPTQLEVFNRQNRKLPAVVLTQIKGIQPDLEEAHRINKDADIKVQNTLNAINSNKDVKEFISRFGGFNPNSPSDVVNLFKYLGFDLSKEVVTKTDEGRKVETKDSSDEETLSKIDHPVAKWILEIRKLTNKLQSTYLSPFIGKESLVYPDGKFHPFFNVNSTATLRLSSDSPNFQNFPKHTDEAIVRKAIRVPKGYKLVSLDYGQIEYRTAVMNSKDPVLRKAVFMNYDVHKDWAIRIAKAHPKRVGGDLNKFLNDKTAIKELRSTTKNQWVFAGMFNASVKSKAEGMEIPFDIAKELDKQFWTELKALKEWQNKTYEFVRKNGYVETLTNYRRRYGKRTPYLEMGEIVNTPIQESAATIVMDAFCRISEYAIETNQEKYTPIWQLHDDLGFIFPEETVEEDYNKIAYMMLDCKFPFINVPLAVEVSIGDNWLEMHEVKTITSVDVGLMENPYKEN